VTATPIKVAAVRSGDMRSIYHRHAE